MTRDSDFWVFKNAPCVRYVVVPRTFSRSEQVRREEIAKVHRLITLQLGTSVMVAVKAEMKAATAADLVADINRAEAALRAEFPEIQWLFFEPDTAD